LELETAKCLYHNQIENMDHEKCLRYCLDSDHQALSLDKQLNLCETCPMNKNIQKTSFTIYRIDETNHITYVNKSWETFAKENNGLPSCGFQAIKGHSIWEYFSDEETEMIYQNIFTKARTSKKTIEFNIHCDSIKLIRVLKTQVIPLLENHLELRFELVDETIRDTFEMIKFAQSTENIISMCSYCGDLKDAQGNWKPLETEVTNQDLFQHSVLPKISHGICLSCKHDLLDSFHKGNKTSL